MLPQSLSSFFLLISLSLSLLFFFRLMLLPTLLFSEKRGQKKKVGSEFLSVCSPLLFHVCCSDTFPHSRFLPALFASDEAMLMRIFLFAGFFSPFLPLMYVWFHQAVPLMSFCACTGSPP